MDSRERKEEGAGRWRSDLPEGGMRRWVRKVRAFFESCGAIASVRVPPPRRDEMEEGKRNRGIAFIVFSSASGVLQAISMDRDMMDGKPLKVRGVEARDACLMNC